MEKYNGSGWRSVGVVVDGLGSVYNDRNQCDVLHPLCQVRKLKRSITKNATEVDGACWDGSGGTGRSVE